MWGTPPLARFNFYVKIKLVSNKPKLITVEAKIMNLKNICKLVKDAGQSRAIITIDTSGDDAVLFLNIPTAGGFDTGKVSSEEMKLRAALSTPLRVIGKVADVDAMIDQQVSEFGEGFIVASQELVGTQSNAGANKNKCLNAVAASKNTPKAVKKTTPKTTANKSTTTKASAVKQAETPNAAMPEIETHADDNFDMFLNDSAL